MCGDCTSDALEDGCVSLKVHRPKSKILTKAKQNTNDFIVGKVRKEWTSNCKCVQIIPKRVMVE